MKPKLKEIVKEVEGKLQCNCDLDSWQPELDTGHSQVCQIHMVAKERFLRGGLDEQIRLRANRNLKRIPHGL